MNIFSNWKSHDVAAHNERVAKRLGAGGVKPREAVGLEVGESHDLAGQPSGQSLSSRRTARPFLEADFHDKVESYCRGRGWYYLHSRTDRRTTVAVGAPDFCIAMPEGKVLWLELKRPGGKATVKQQATIAHLRKLGHVAAVVDNWEDAYLLLR